MNDKELLEFSAKAAGITGCYNLHDRSMRIELAGGVHSWWSPLDNDGDALRLAIRLGIAFCRNSNCVFSQLETDPSCDEQIWKFMEEIDGNAFIATRRVIVRAAAEIGKNM